MRRPFLEGSVRKRGRTEATGCLAAIAGTLMLVVAISLVAGLPPGLERGGPCFAIASLIFALLTGGVWWRSSIPLRVGARGGSVYLEIDDPSRPLVLKLPVRIEYGWFSSPMGRAGPQIVMVLGIYSEERLEVSISEIWGPKHPPPRGWREGVSPKEPPTVTYESGGGQLLPSLVSKLQEWS